MKRKDSRQHDVLKELFAAQKQGFIIQIDADLKNRAGKVLYDQEMSMYKTDWEYDTKGLTEDIQVDVAADMNHFLPYEKLYVQFSLSVKNEQMKKIASYIKQKYNCQCSLKNHQMCVYDFSII